MNIEKKISAKNPAGVETKHSHAKHIKMMVICCGVPILGFMAIGLFGINAPSLETFLLVICPIGMGAMIWMMMREQRADSRGRSCCQSDSAGEELAKNDHNHNVAQATDPRCRKLAISDTEKQLSDEGDRRVQSEKPSDTALA